MCTRTNRCVQCSTWPDVQWDLYEARYKYSDRKRRSTSSSESGRSTDTVIPKKSKTMSSSPGRLAQTEYRSPLPETRRGASPVEPPTFLARADLVALARLQGEPEDSFLPSQTTRSDTREIPTTVGDDSPFLSSQNGDRPSAEGCSGTRSVDRSQTNSQQGTSARSADRSQSDRQHKGARAPSKSW